MKTIEIPTANIDFLLNIHPAWYAFVDQPDLKAGDEVLFTSNDKIIAARIVLRILPPGMKNRFTDEFNTTYLSWWRVIWN